MNKELEQLKAQAEAQGWVIQLRKTGHYRWLSPTGGFVVTSSTPSDHRAVLNIRRDLKRYGLVVTNKKEK
jgi:hypothetical protein